MANTSQATVIFLHSHPAWIAAQQQAHAREEAMLRHPSCRGRGRTTVSGGDDASPRIRGFSAYSSTDTPA